MSEFTRSFQQDYLSGNALLTNFYSHKPNLDGLQNAIGEREAAGISYPGLGEVIRRQYGELRLSSPLSNNLDLLGKPDVYTVTTGHQLCIFGGPLFTAYKILTVIRLAEELKKKHPQKEFIPVFWIASEDHDAAEIKSFPDADGKLISYPGNFSGAVGRHVIEASISHSIALPGRDFFSKFYSPGKSWAQAFRELWNVWLGDRGLVIVDGDDPELKRRFIPILEKEISEQITWKRGEATNTLLEQAGYPIQLKFREINLFYLTDDRRDGILVDDETFFLKDGTRWTKSELLDECRLYPERFSPNAALRPVYQEWILPNLAYSGGWGEFAYWFQLKGIFEALDVPYPVLIPRKSATLLRQAEVSALEVLSLSPNDLNRDSDELKEALIRQFWNEARLTDAEQQLLSGFSRVSQLLSETDPTLVGNLNAEKSKLESYFMQLHKKIRKSIRNRHPSRFKALDDLIQFTRPGGKLQERVLDLTSIRHGAEKELLNDLYSRFNPFSFEQEWIRLD